MVASGVNGGLLFWQQCDDKENGHFVTPSYESTFSRVGVKPLYVCETSTKGGGVFVLAIGRKKRVFLSTFSGYCTSFIWVFSVWNVKSVLNMFNTWGTFLKLHLHWLVKTMRCGWNTHTHTSCYCNLPFIIITPVVIVITVITISPLCIQSDEAWFSC